MLPTTPLLLLAAACYARSSDRFYRWLVTNRWFGEYISDYRQGRGIRMRQKALVLALLWLTITYTAGFAVAIWWVRLLLLVIAAAVTWHVLTIRTYRPERQATSPLPEGDPVAD